VQLSSLRLAVTARCAAPSRLLGAERNARQRPPADHECLLPLGRGDFVLPGSELNDARLLRVSFRDVEPGALPAAPHHLYPRETYQRIDNRGLDRDADRCPELAGHRAVPPILAATQPIRPGEHGGGVSARRD
jgi:hypothetical protein